MEVGRASLVSGTHCCDDGFTLGHSEPSSPDNWLALLCTTMSHG